MAKTKACPYAKIKWTDKNKRYEAGCYFVGECKGDPKCEHFDIETKKRAREILNF